MEVPVYFKICSDFFKLRNGAIYFKSLYFKKFLFKEWLFQQTRGQKV